MFSIPKPRELPTFCGTNPLSCSHVCNCSCHRTGAVHVVACCSGCFLCNRNIRINCMDEHKEMCHGQCPWCGSSIEKDMMDEHKENCPDQPKY